MPSTALPITVDTEVPSWKSPNELIHERINFDDTIWGFGLAGGAYYKTPLRITYVLPDSRAQKAHIYPGDVVLKINGIDSSQLTLDEAHRMIVESGIHLKINVTSPEDLEDNYFSYQDPLELQYAQELKAKDRKQRATLNFSKISGKCSHWSLQWPWKCRRKTIWKESNCYLVPSKYEEKHKDTRKPEIKQDDMIVLDSIHNVDGKKNYTVKRENKDESQKNEENFSNNIKDDGGIVKQQSSVENNEGSVRECNDAADKNNSENSAKEISSVAKNDENAELRNAENKNYINDVTEQNRSTDKNDENNVNELSSTTDKGDEAATELSGAANNSDKQPALEVTDAVDKNDNEATQQSGTVNKNDDEAVIKLSDTMDKNDDEVAPEQTSSVEKNVDNSFTEHESSEHNNKEQNSVETSDLIDINKTNDDNVKFESGDIPGISESEKLTHNSR